MAALPANAPGAANALGATATTTEATSAPGTSAVSAMSGASATFSTATEAPARSGAEPTPRPGVARRARTTTGRSMPANARDVPRPAAESIRRELAIAWGELGSAWGVTPATARVHGYLLGHRRALTEREIRLALGLSHRATSLALAESVAWGLVERAPGPRRAGTRGPAGAAWVAIDDHWRWFGRVVEQRRLREGDPAVAAIERTLAAARAAADERPDDPELGDLRDWLSDCLAFVRLLDRAAALLARVPPRDLERATRFAGRVRGGTALRMLGLLGAIDDEDVVPLVEGLGRLAPADAPRAARLFSDVLRRLAR